jgi:hypothetical protein
MKNFKKQPIKSIFGGALRDVASIIFLPYSHTIEILHQKLYLIKLLTLCED